LRGLGACRSRGRSRHGRSKASACGAATFFNPVQLGRLHHREIRRIVAVENAAESALERRRLNRGGRRCEWSPSVVTDRMQINQLQIKQTWPGQARPGHPDLHLSKRSESALSSRGGNVLWTNSSRTLRSLRKLSHNLSRNLGNLGNLRSGSLGPVVRRAAAFRRSPCRRHRTSPSSHRRFPLH
jgi:hypothetical protein